MQTSQVLLILVPTAILCCVCARSVPDYNSDIRNKRQIVADIEMSQRQAEAGLGHIEPHACKEFGCGIVNPHERQRRSGSAERRIAEIQALMTLAREHGGRLGHGKVDPISLGKRKRSDDYVDLEDYEDVRRLRLLQRVLDTLTDDTS